MDERKKVVWRSLLLTVLIFAVGILVNHFFDAFRIDTIMGVMRVHEIDSESYEVEGFFRDTFGEEGCDAMSSHIGSFKEEIRKVGEDLNSYSRFSFFRKTDYDYLKRKYFLLELHFFSLLERLNRECDDPYIPVLFFYEIDDDASERQGYILQELSKEYESEVVVFSLDKDYKDEPLVQVLAQAYNVTSAPALVIDGTAYSGLIYTGPLNATLQKRLRKVDAYAKGVDFMFTLRATGSNVSLLEWQLRDILMNESASAFARGDASLILGRLGHNDSQVCESLQFFDAVNVSTHEEAALVYETSASLGCGRNRRAFLRAASKEWMSAGNVFRAKLLDDLESGKGVHLVFDEDALNANITVIGGYVSVMAPNLVKRNVSEVVIGASSVVLNGSSVLVSQDDRVFRDWLGGQLASPYGPELLVTFSERLTYPASELQEEMGWHEGALIKELGPVNLTHYAAVGTLVAQKGERWFAVDDAGVFRFEVPPDKVYYPTTRFLAKGLAVIIDTHGINMLVESAMRHNASAVIGCCDHPGKVYAAQYLAKRNVSVICVPDKYEYLALGHNLSMVGSPPFVVENGTAVVGGRPVVIRKSDRIVAVNASASKYALWYYETPASYMDELRKAYGLNVTFVSIDDFGQMGRVVDKAREINASVVSVRVFDRSDYDAVKGWLDEDVLRTAVLFHSASYPFGKRLFAEYVNQTSFDDPNPVVI